jgi:DNA-binding response OmpR family regulator
MQKVLILENDWLVLSLLTDFFKKQHCLVNCVQSIKRAEELLKQCTFDLLLCERILPDGDVLPF